SRCRSTISFRDLLFGFRSEAHRGSVHTTAKSSPRVQGADRHSNRAAEDFLSRRGAPSKFLQSQSFESIRRERRDAQGGQDQEVAAGIIEEVTRRSPGGLH